MAWTERLLVVVRAADRDTANSAAQVADPTTDGNTFRAALRAQGSTSLTPGFFWTSWLMTVEQRDRLVAEFSRVAGSLPVILAGGRVNKNSRYWLFDARPGQWSPEQALAALALELAPANRD